MAGSRIGRRGTRIQWLVPLPVFTYRGRSIRFPFRFSSWVGPWSLWSVKSFFCADAAPAERVFISMRFGPTPSSAVLQFRARNWRSLMMDHWQVSSIHRTRNPASCCFFCRRFSLLLQLKCGGTSTDGGWGQNNLSIQVITGRNLVDFLASLCAVKMRLSESREI